MTREQQLNVRLSEDEAARLEFLCKHHGITSAALFRQLMAVEERRVREHLSRLEAQARQDLVTKAIGLLAMQGHDASKVSAEASELDGDLLVLRDAKNAAIAEFVHDAEVGPMHLKFSRLVPKKRGAK